jgi:hypothetical protein
VRAAVHSCQHAQNKQYENQLQQSWPQKSLMQQCSKPNQIKSINSSELMLCTRVSTLQWNKNSCKGSSIRLGRVSETLGSPSRCIKVLHIRGSIQQSSGQSVSVHRKTQQQTVAGVRKCIYFVATTRWRAAQDFSGYSARCSEFHTTCLWRKETGLDSSALDSYNQGGFQTRFVSLGFNSFNGTSSRARFVSLECMQNAFVKQFSQAISNTS